MIPRSTYRLQFHKGFSFIDAAQHARYFADLGISHIYASPILTARAGSMHGYNVVDYTHINPELGGEDAFVRFVAVLHQHGIGIIADIVPNHMAVGMADNTWWLDVLENGRSSIYAPFFDIDWDVPGLQGKVLVPFLDGSPDDCFADGSLKLVKDSALGKWAFAYYGHRFVLRPEDAVNLNAADISKMNVADTAALLARQHYVLSDWRQANARINWRRFFDINELAALRMEYEPAFDAVHAKILSLYGRGLIDGLRVDHVDGLADPRLYCRKLRARLQAVESQRPANAERGPAWLVVEKILGEDEALSGDWQVDGTTGYDFMNDVSAVLHAPDSGAGLSLLWARVSGRSAAFELEERTARAELLETSFSAQHQAAAYEFCAAVQSLGGNCELTAMKRVLRALLIELRCYRTYATGKPGSPPPGALFERAYTQAARNIRGDAAEMEWLKRIMADTSGDAVCIAAVRRFNQLAAPVAAKAVEDTAFYRYGRLLSRNDVGFDPAVVSMTPDMFHKRMQDRQERSPNTMLATATHDHKRGEDGRVRLAVLSEIPELWSQTVGDWFTANTLARPAGLDAGDEYQLYQTLVGAWPMGALCTEERASFAARAEMWCRKFLREAKLRSRWAAPDIDYEDRMAGFVRHLINEPAASAAIMDFVGQIAPAACANSLAQMVLHCTSPGVPDIYQGRERWDFTMVDPDNRQPVDYDLRQATMDEPNDGGALTDDWMEGAFKQAVLAKLLRLRKSHALVFQDGDYLPLRVMGARARHVVAFARSHAQGCIIVLAARCCAAPLLGGAQIVPNKTWWADTAVALNRSDTEFTNIVDGNALIVKPVEHVSHLLAAYPICVLTTPC